MPGAGLLAQHPAQPLAVEVHPLIPGALGAHRQVRQVSRRDPPQGGVHPRLAVGERQRRQGAPGVAGRRRPWAGGRAALVAALHHRPQHRVARLFRIGQRRGGGLLVAEIGGLHQAMGPHLRLIREVVQHQHPPAEAPGAHLEARPVAGEGIRAHAPAAAGAQLRVDGIGLLGGQAGEVAVVEAQLEHPGVCITWGLLPGVAGSSEAGQEWCAVSVDDALGVGGRLAAARRPVRFPQRPPVHAGAVFHPVAIHCRVALVVVGLAEEPLVDPGRILRIEHPAFRAAAIPGGDVVAADRAPEHLRRIVRRRPALDAGEQPLDAGAIAADAVVAAIHLNRLFGRERTAGRKHGHQILGAGQQEGVALGGIEILGQAPVGLAANAWNPQRPAQPERPIARAGVVAQAQLRPEAPPAGADRQRHRHRAGACHRVGGELFAHAPNRPAPLGKADRGGLNGEALAVTSGLGNGSSGAPRHPSRHRARPRSGLGSRGCQPGSADLACSGWGWGHQPQRRQPCFANGK